MKQMLPSKLQMAVGQGVSQLNIGRNKFRKNKDGQTPKNVSKFSAAVDPNNFAATQSTGHTQVGLNQSINNGMYPQAGFPGAQFGMHQGFTTAGMQHHINSPSVQYPDRSVQQQQPYHIPISNIPNQACYVHHQVSVDQVVEEENRVSVNGLLHFFWVQDAVHPKTKEIIVDSGTRQNIRGAELLYHLQEHRGFEIQSKVANRVVVLKPLNDDKCCMPVPSKRTKPLALFRGLDGEVTVDRTLFYPDIGIIHLAYKFNGWLTQPMPCFRFPFDRHALKLEILTRDNPPTSLFDPIGNGVGMRIVVAPPASIVTFFHFLLDESQSKLSSPVDVQIGTRMAEGWKLGPDPRHLQCLDFSRGGDCPLPTLVIPLERNNGALLCRTLTPAYLFGMLSLSSFAMPSHAIFERTMIVMVALASLLLLRFALSSSLPKFRSITLLDYYFIVTYFFLALVEMLNLVAYGNSSSTASGVKDEQAKGYDSGCASGLGVFWSLSHVGLLLLRDSVALRGSWDYIVTKTKMRHSFGVDATRVFPIRNQDIGNVAQSNEPARETALTAVLKEEIGPKPSNLKLLNGNLHHSTVTNSSTLLGNSSGGMLEALTDNSTRNQSPLERVTSNEKKKQQMGVSLSKKSSFKSQKRTIALGSQPRSNAASPAKSNPLVSNMQQSSRRSFSSEKSNLLESLAEQNATNAKDWSPRSHVSTASGTSKLEEMMKGSK